MSESSQRPLVTFAVIAYKQERFIREAIEGAFAQTYSPLEIILSDDCSPDRTFEIMQEMAAGYRGPHRLRLNRNAVNLGVGSHVNRVVELADGELIVPAAGDDFSISERVGILVDEWLRACCKPAAMISAYQEMDSNGALGEVRSNQPPDGSDLTRRVKIWNSNVGCAEAFTKQIFAEFGPLSSDIVSEDAVVFFRAWAIHPVVYVAKPLVHYRIHDDAITSQAGATLDHRASLSKHRRLLAARASTFKQYLKDLDSPLMASIHSEQELMTARMMVTDELRSSYYAWNFSVADRGGRFQVLKSMMRSGVPVKRLIAWLVRVGFPSVDHTVIRRHSQR